MSYLQVCLFTHGENGPPHRSICVARNIELLREHTDDGFDGEPSGCEVNLVEWSAKREGVLRHASTQLQMRLGMMIVRLPDIVVPKNPLVPFAIKLVLRRFL